MRLGYFRAFRDSGLFRLAPLTCIVGRNSGGKSSLLSALLVLKQSVTDTPLSTRMTPLALSGSIFDLGSYADIVYNHNSSKRIRIELVVPISPPRKSISGGFHAAARPT